jgi:hypothetical protein
VIENPESKACCVGIVRLLPLTVPFTGPQWEILSIMIAVAEEDPAEMVNWYE